MINVIFPAKNVPEIPKKNVKYATNRENYKKENVLKIVKMVILKIQLTNVKNVTRYAKNAMVNRQMNVVYVLKICTY